MVEKPNPEDLNIFLDQIEKRAVSKQSKVAMGVRNPNEKTIQCIKNAIDLGYADLVLVGNEEEIKKASLSVYPESVIESDLLPFEIYDTNEPEKDIVNLLVTDKVDAAIRGKSKASDVLSCIKETCNVQNLHRLALLISGYGKPFFLAPVGIDEGATFEDKLQFICLGATFLRRFGVSPCIGILSEDEFDDSEFLKIKEEMKDKNIKFRFYGHDVQSAIEKSNFVLAPNGISGNLIFRSLVFLGGGTGLGAPMLMDRHIFVDTSRSYGNFTKAIMVASALSKKP